MKQSAFHDLHTIGLLKDWVSSYLSFPKIGGKNRRKKCSSSSVCLCVYKNLRNSYPFPFIGSIRLFLNNKLPFRLTLFFHWLKINIKKIQNFKQVFHIVPIFYFSCYKSREKSGWLICSKSIQNITSIGLLLFPYYLYVKQ